MTDEERASYRRQFEQHERRLPRGHVINHCTWRDGHLSVMSGPVERQQVPRDSDGPRRVRRGAAQEDLFA